MLTKKEMIKGWGFFLITILLIIAGLIFFEIKFKNVDTGIFTKNKQEEIVKSKTPSFAEDGYQYFLNAKPFLGFIVFLENSQDKKYLVSFEYSDIKEIDVTMKIVENINGDRLPYLSFNVPKTYETNVLFLNRHKDFVQRYLDKYDFDANEVVNEEIFADFIDKYLEVVSGNM